MTPDPSDLGGLVVTLVVTTVSSLLIAAAVYVWTGLAMSRLFARLSVEPWRGWVPLLNVAEVLALGGSPRWIALLFLVPIANIYALVMFAIAAHRVNVLFGRGAGMTVLAVLVLPAWASVLAWGRTAPDPERGRLATAIGGQAQAQPTGPLAVPPEPVAPRPEPAAGAGMAEARAFPPLPGLEHQAPVRPGAQPVAEQPAAPALVPPPPAAITPPPGLAPSTGWPVSPPARHTPPPAQPTQAPATAFAPGSEPAAAQHGFPPHPPTGQPVPPAGATQTWPPGPPQSVPPTGAPAAAPAAPWSPGPDLATPNHSSATPTSVPAADASGPAALAGSGAHAAPAVAPHAPVDDPHGGLDFADAATIVASGDEGSGDEGSGDEGSGSEDLGDVEATVIVDRRPRRVWRLELDDGEVLALTDEVVVLGRNPSAAAAEQRLAVPDRTRTLSKTHARLAHRNGVWTVTDLGSTNGVLIVDTTGEETLIEPDVETTVSGRFVLGEVGMRVTEATA